MDFFSTYFKFVGRTEAPMQFHRWCALSCLSSILGRKVWMPFGHTNIFPNQYILLIGEPATRKSTAIGIARKALEASGYKRFAKERTSPERFFIDMAKPSFLDDPEEDFEMLVPEQPSEMAILNGEFLDFIGRNNMDFLTALTNLWDNLPVYEHPKIHGKSVCIYQPTLNILGGATVKGLGLSIPPEAIGTGILSRLILVQGELTGKKITFPDPVDKKASDEVVETLMRIRREMKGEIGRSPEAEKIMDRIYKNCVEIPDARFTDYAGRRFIHFLKIAILIAISEGRKVIETEDALKANTILYAAERRMPKALGEFGRSKYSDVTNTIMNILNRAIAPVSHAELWKIVSKDLSEIKELGTVMRNLLSSDRVQIVSIKGIQGYMPKHASAIEWEHDLLLEDYLTTEEGI